MMWMWFGNYGISALNVIIGNVFGKKNIKYIKEPILRNEAIEKEENTNKESKEETAVFEMKQRINVLRKQGLPESPI